MKNFKHVTPAKGKVSVKFNPDRTALLVSGRLNFVDVVEIRKMGKELIHEFLDTTVIMDLTEVKSGDNSGLVLLLAWLRDARDLGKTLVFTQVPDFLSRMARVFELEDILFAKIKT